MPEQDDTNVCWAEEGDNVTYILTGLHVCSELREKGEDSGESRDLKSTEESVLKKSCGYLCPTSSIGQVKVAWEQTIR